MVAGGQPELMLVSGYSGSGKSAVVYEFHKALMPPRGLPRRGLAITASGHAEAVVVATGQFHVTHEVIIRRAPA